MQKVIHCSAKGMPSCCEGLYFPAKVVFFGIKNAYFSDYDK